MGTAYLLLRILPGSSQVKYHGFELKLHSLWQKQGVGTPDHADYKPQLIVLQSFVEEKRERKEITQ